MRRLTFYNMFKALQNKERERREIYIQHPVWTNQIPRQIPDQPWYLSPCSEKPFFNSHPSINRPFFSSAPMVSCPTTFLLGSIGTTKKREGREREERGEKRERERITYSTCES